MRSRRSGTAVSANSARAAHRSAGGAPRGTQSVDDIIVVGGGVIPDDDVVALKGMGVAEILLQDTSPTDIVTTLRRLVEERGER